MKVWSKFSLSKPLPTREPCVVNKAASTTKTTPKKKGCSLPFTVHYTPAIQLRAPVHIAVSTLRQKVTVVLSAHLMCEDSEIQLAGLQLFVFIFANSSWLTVVLY